MKETMPGRAFALINYSLLFLIALTTLFPFAHILAQSVSSSRAIASGEVLLWPVDATWVNFKVVIDQGILLLAMKNSVVVAAVGTLLNMTATVLAAYPLSRRRLRGRVPLSMMIVFTMMFHAGLIPNFILIKSLGLLDSYWALWLPALISAYNMFVMKTYFEGIPAEIEESAAMEGANDIGILWRIILPLSKPMLAALSLFYAVTWWNAYFNVMVYISTSEKKTLMLHLYQLLQSVRALMGGQSEVDTTQTQMLLSPEGLKAASIVVAVTPILLVYPFLQKYFVKGVLIGSVKG